jgi:hypothetical protein
MNHVHIALILLPDYQSIHQNGVLHEEGIIFFKFLRFLYEVPLHVPDKLGFVDHVLVLHLCIHLAVGDASYF